MDDNKIVDLLFERNEKALDEIKNKYNVLLNSISFNILKNNEDVSECLNDTYLKVWGTIPPLKPTYLNSYLCKLIRQISIDKYRYNNRESRSQKKEVLLSDLDFEISDNRDLNDEVSERLLESTINNFLDTLDAQTRIIFVRKYFMLESSKDISKRYGISENNINVKMLRVKKNLKKYLEKEGYEI